MRWVGMIKIYPFDVLATSFTNSNRQVYDYVSEKKGVV